MSERLLQKGLCLVLAAAALGCEEGLTQDPRSRLSEAGTPGIIAAGGRSALPVAGGSSAVCQNGVVPASSVSTRSASAMPSLLARDTVQSETPPPPISGGTMLTTADGTMIVAADPERDQVYFLDAQGMKSLFTRKLNPGDQPGRVVEDAAGRIHVVLRSAHAIASLGRAADSEITRREVCAVPRGIAYDPAGDQLHIACAEGKLVTLAAAPSALLPTRTLDVATDARDVLVRGDTLFVSRFRAAELLVLGADGALQETRVPASFARDEMRKGLAQKRAADGSCSFESSISTVHVEETPDVAWRTIDVPKVGVTMLHQRAHTDEVQVTMGGYGAGTCGGGIVQTAITTGLDMPTPATADAGDLTLAVDIAADPEGQLLAVASPGNRGGFRQLELIAINQLAARSASAAAASSAALPTVTPSAPGTSSGAASTAAAPAKAPAGGAPCMSGTSLPEPPGQATAVTFASPYVLAVQQRDPAAVSFYDVRTNMLRATVTLDEASRFDTGHTLFHMRAGAGLACASCHPEAGDDGHVWTFATIGPRRTQTLRGGILGTEPLHWNGDMEDFSTLMSEVFVGRMSGFAPSAAQTDALSHWLDKQPALHADVADATAAERGKALFESSTVGCASCHSGAHLTNNTTQDVGTGAMLQVPSLKGVRFRTPLMHDGCAANISERLTRPECGGGDEHGKTSQLSASELQDLGAYLETL